MTNRERHDREDLRLMEKWLAAHLRRGTEPTSESLNRYQELRARVADAGSVAA
jgi:hypothetical protein